MLIQILVPAAIGLLVGGVLGCLATRRARFLTLYMIAGMLGALIYAILPMIRGFEYIQSAPKPIAIAAGLASGLTILFSSGGR